MGLVYLSRLNKYFQINPTQRSIKPPYLPIKSSQYSYSKVENVEWGRIFKLWSRRERLLWKIYGTCVLFRTHSISEVRFVRETNYDVKIRFHSHKDRTQFSLLRIVIEYSVWTWILKRRFGICQRLKKRQLYFSRKSFVAAHNKKVRQWTQPDFIHLREGTFLEV